MNSLDNDRALLLQLVQIAQAKLLLAGVFFVAHHQHHLVAAIVDFHLCHQPDDHFVLFCFQISQQSSKNIKIQLATANSPKGKSPASLGLLQLDNDAVDDLVAVELALGQKTLDQLFWLIEN